MPIYSLCDPTAGNQKNGCPGRQRSEHHEEEKRETVHDVLLAKKKKKERVCGVRVRKRGHRTQNPWEEKRTVRWPGL